MKALLTRKSNTQRHSNLLQTSISRPKPRVGSQMCGRQQMKIDKANALTHQIVRVEQVHRLFMTGLKRNRQVPPELQQLGSILQIATSQLTNNHRMNANPILPQQIGQSFITLAQKINPHRSIHQNHDLFGTDRRRPATVRFGSEPPKADNRRALSRSISAFKLSRISAVFSFTPHSATAWAYNSSSIFNVVRISKLPASKFMHQFMHHYMHKFAYLLPAKKIMGTRS